MLQYLLATFQPRQNLGVENFSIQHAPTFLKALLLVDGIFRNLTPVYEEILKHVLEILSRLQRDDPFLSKPWLQIQVATFTIALLNHCTAGALNQKTAGFYLTLATLQTRSVSDAALRRSEGRTKESIDA